MNLSPILGRTRPAFTLTETVIVMGILVTVVAGAGAFLSRAYVADRHVRMDIAVQQSLARLAQQLRADIRRGTTVNLAAENDQQINLILDEDPHGLSHIEYVYDRGVMLRRLRRGEDLAGTEIYPLTVQWRATWNIPETNTQPCELRLQRGTQGEPAIHSAVLSDFIIMARLGADRRFVTPPGNTGANDE